MARPQLCPDSHQLSVLMAGDDYRLLRQLHEKARAVRPGYSLGEFVRSLLSERLAQEAGKRLSRSRSDDPVRRLHAIARSAKELARELERKKPRGKAA